METGFVGGVFNRTEPWPTLTGGPQEQTELWQWVGRETVAFVQVRGRCCRLFSQGPLALVIRGYVARSWTIAPLDLDGTAQTILHHYLSHGQLSLEGLEGSFTLALLDGRAGRLLLYRNLVGNGFAYYRETAGGALFASNLATLFAIGSDRPAVNDAALPTYFLNRCVPGRETLARDHYRLLPGEQVDVQTGKLSRLQRRTLGDYRDDRPASRDTLDQLEGTMGRVLADYRALRPDAANLLSGGVDSSYLQAHWNVTQPTPSRPVSFCVSVDHPRSHPDTAYALSAAEALGTRHVLVPADEPYAHYLTEAIAATGEPPNHVQTAYFLHLGRAMAEHGAGTGLCGEGADSLFGLDLTCHVQNAALLRQLCPLRPLRRGGAALARALRFERVRQYLQLADYVHDQADLRHPINQAAVFADWPVVEACFGPEAVEEAAASRRALLDQHHVPTDSLERLHAAGFLGSAVNTAALKTTLFNVAGNDLLCPFLDSRLLRFVLSLPPRDRFPFRRPKALLKRALARQGHAELAYRRKLGFGQPIFEWLAPGGVLRPMVEEIADHAFLGPQQLTQARERPGWFLYSLLCFDLWYKQFVRGSLARPLTVSEALAA